MAALQITVGGTAQNVARLITTTAPMNAPSSLSGVNFVGSNITKLIDTSPPITTAAFLANPNNFLGDNITNLIIVEGLGTSPGGGGGSSEPASKESWE